MLVACCLPTASGPDKPCLPLATQPSPLWSCVCWPLYTHTGLLLTAQLVGGSKLRHFNVDAALEAQAHEPDGISCTGFEQEVSADSLTAAGLLLHPRVRPRLSIFHDASLSLIATSHVLSTVQSSLLPDISRPRL